MPYADPEKRRAYAREWMKRNPDKAREAMRRWRQTHRAVLCAYDSAPGPLHADHRLPLARGGTNEISNILPACARCNLRKHLMTEAEFRARLAAEGHAF